MEFAGIVRDTENGRPLLGLTYESYTPMVIRQISNISHRLNEQYPIISIDFHHRIGLVHYGEASLFIRVRSERRINALRFTEHFIDLLKQEVPIWKHPVFKTDR